MKRDKPGDNKQRKEDMTTTDSMSPYLMEGLNLKMPK